DAELAALALAREGEALDLAPGREIVIHDEIVALAIARIETVHHLWLEQPGRGYFPLQLFFDRPVLLFDQPGVVGSGSRLELPLVLEQRSLIHIRENLVEIEIRAHAAANERRLRNVRRRRHYRRALGGHLAVSGAGNSGARELLHDA